MCLAVALNQMSRLPLDLFVLHEELNEDRDLGTQDHGHDGLVQEVNGTQCIAALDLLVGALVGGEKKERGVP